MRIYKKTVILLIALLIALGALGCSKQIVIEDSANNKSTKDNTELIDKQKEDNISKNIDNKSNEEIVQPVDYNKLNVNENGKVMILMYHGIGEKEQEWVRTPDNFRKDLQTLYENGYRLIKLKDYIENNIKVEAGFTPFVITFDDGLKNQFNIIEENGVKKIDSNCAVGILEDFIAKHPDFGRGASFYVYYPIPFRQKSLIKEKYDFLIDNGYEIGNHGYNHENLGKSTLEQVQKSLAKNAMNTNEYIEEFEVYSLALPYGASPKGDNYKYVVTGEYEGFKYNHRAILRVGSNPANAPNNLKFDSTRLPRVRASETNTSGLCLYDWLAHFEKKPYERYISDGNPNTIVIPINQEEKLNLDSIKGKEIIKY